MSLNENLIIANVISNQIDNVIEKSGSTFSKVGKKLLTNFKIGLNKYLNELYEKQNTVKTFLVNNEKPVALKSIYTPIKLRLQNYKSFKPRINNLLSKSNKVIINGTGGAGKTILLKYLTIDCIENSEYVPIYIALRDLNDNFINLEKSLFESLTSTKSDVSLDVFNKLKSSGKLLIILDGFDEIKYELRPIVEKEINKISNKLDCPIILSSRPGDDLKSLITFTTFYTTGLDLYQSIELITKLNFDNVIKEKFISELKDGFFKDHQSFLSNPLLLTIMLLIYGRTAEIPNKLSIFYASAYDALFQAHDANKGAFKREKKTNLDIQDFKKAFAAFCILTYSSRKFNFLKTEIVELIDQSKSITSLEFSSSDFLYDMNESTCLLVENGLYYSFSHRSFQEYFTAFFISIKNDSEKQKLYQKFQKYISTDNVFNLSLELDQDFVEEKILLPFIVNLLKNIDYSSEVNIHVFLKFIQLMWLKFSVDNIEEELTLLGSELNSVFNNTVGFLVKNYKSLWTKYGQEDNDSLDSFCEANYERTFLTKSLNSDNEIIKILFESNKYFSPQVIYLLIEIRNHFEIKFLEREKSVLDILINT